MNEITEGTASAWEPVVFEGIAQDRTLNFIKVEEHTTLVIMNMLDVLIKANDATGSHVELLPEFSYCPILKDSSGDVLPLYKFIEILDECLDYEDVKAEMPSFSFAQIEGAISFLRKIAQFNLASVDIDEEIDQQLLKDIVFRNELQNGLADQESMHVLNFNQCDR